MKVFHDSRALEYRSPYGAVAPGTQVTLAVDVIDAPDATATLRTWTESAGEQLIPMSPCARADANGKTSASPTDSTRFVATMTPDAEGVVWYHFIVNDKHGNVKRYGARDGRRGGQGQLRDWEPPSFQLTVRARGVVPPAWHEPIESYLRDGASVHDLPEIAETLRENYPIGVFCDDIPWDYRKAEAPASPDSAVKSPDDAIGISYKAPTFTCGDTRCFTVGDDVFGFWRIDEAGNPLCVLLNTSPSHCHNVSIPMVDEEVSELIDGYAVNVVDAATNADAAAQAPCDLAGSTHYACAHLHHLGAAILHFHARYRLQKPLDEGLGVLAHVTSLPAEGSANLGEPAHAFIEWLAQTGARYWQVLPANPTDEFGSPYAGISAFAGNESLLATADADEQSAPSSQPDEYRAFLEREGDWLEPYVCFMAIRQKVGAQTPWWEWPKNYRTFHPSILDDEELNRYAETRRQAQFAFEQQWKSLRAHANEHGISIIGDMPIYVSADSVDVWANPDVFQLGPDGRPAVVAGCPPDAFAVDGQVWGNPVYDWEALREDGYAWWLRRLQRAFDLYDYVRLDHFIGFSRYFSIPAGEKATTGRYHKGPGIAFFQKAFERFGPLPVIAEDLGLITPRVRELVADCGFPGMDIAQFVDGNDPLGGYAPRPEKIAYTGTHDNQTLVGYVAERYHWLDAWEVAKTISENVAACDAPVCVLPLQDLMGLDDEARMNVPGTAGDNWTWQADQADMDRALAFARILAQLCQ